MRYSDERAMHEEQLKLIREISAQPMSWNKLGKMFKLNALLRRRRDWNTYY